MKTKVVVFDADGVLIFPWHFANYLTDNHGITREMTRPFFTGPFLQCLVGKADLKEEIRPFLPQWGWQGSVDALLQIWFDVENAPDPQMMTAVAALRQKGFICCLATNQEQYRFQYMQDEMRFATLFDHLFASCTLGCMKPDISYYQQITDTVDVAPSEILFWDDSAGNVSGARDFGWQAEKFTSYEQFAQHMEPFGLSE
ncbi:MAG: HAD family phosphatase [Chloroflexota bacterium]